MIRLILMRIPRHQENELTEKIRAASEKFALIQTKLDIRIPTTHSAAAQFAEAIARINVCTISNDNLIDDFDRGKSTLSYEHFENPLKLISSAESLASFVLRLRIWSKLLEENSNEENTILVLASGGTIEIIQGIFLDLKEEKLKSILFALDPFHVHIWAGDVLEDGRFAWCLRKANVRLDHCSTEDLPLKTLRLVR